tara:strand:- start:56 stop:394 length:339 start_codon:yes stop_codon:yes gene_type:complete
MSQEQQIKNLKNQKAYAWGKYFGETTANHIKITSLIREIDDLNNDKDLGHILNELRELYKRFRVDVECPICLEVIDEENLKFSSCFHKYCANCLDKLKQTTNKCAVCRKKFK